MNESKKPKTPEVLDDDDLAHVTGAGDLSAFRSKTETSSADQTNDPRIIRSRSGIVIEFDDDA